MSELEEVGKKIIEYGCPILGASLGGVAGIAVKLVCAAFAVTAPEGLLDAINAHPEAKNILEGIEKEHADTLTKGGK